MRSMVSYVLSTLAKTGLFNVPPAPVYPDFPIRVRG